MTVVLADAHFKCMLMYVKSLLVLQNFTIARKSGNIVYVWLKAIYAVNVWVKQIYVNTL